MADQPCVRSLKMKNHDLVQDVSYKEILVEKRPLLDYDNNEVEGLCNYWIFFNNPKQYNSYTTQAVKEVILAMRQASGTRRSARAAIPRSMRSTTRATRRNTNNTCGCSTI
jgi:hypothetical protein